ncbi:MAG: hypothetical protein GXP58_05435 [Deltaproteobacteria bacterium]|nr:hypothetical protein [Deltaproteobacteria bacterium]
MNSANYRDDESGKSAKETAPGAEVPTCSQQDEFVGFVMHRKEYCFYQTYADAGIFKEEMNEHARDVKWALLVRADDGRVVQFFVPGERQKIGLVDTEPKSAEVAPAGLNTQQQALREMAIRHFKSNKAKTFISEQVEYINAKRQIGEGIRFLFDHQGRPPEHVSIEEILSERKNIEAQIKWLEAIVTELYNNLAQLKEFEAGAAELLDGESE